MYRTLFFLAAALFVSCFPAAPIFPAAPDDLLDDTIDLEEIAAGIPSGFDVRTATEEEVRRLPFFSPDEASLVVAYRDSLRRSGRSADFIGAIPGLSSIQRFLLESGLAGLSVRRRGDVSGLMRTGIRFRSSEHESPGKYWDRVEVESGGGFAMGALLEHDSGEPRALDFVSMHAAFPLGLSGCRVVAGDFRPGYGEGLLFSRYTFRYRDGVRNLREETDNPARASFEETRFLRGILLSARRGAVTSELWASARSLDAAIDSSGRAVSIDRTGYHRSSGKRGNLKERISAAHVSIDVGRGNALSVTGAVTGYDPGLARRPGERSFEDPESKVFRHLSVSGRHEDRRTAIFFEHAWMEGGEYAAAGGVTVRSPAVTVTTQAREFSRRFWAPRSGAFSTFGEPSNERGMYTALEASLPAALQLTASADIARTLGRTYFLAMPSSRRQALVTLRKKFGLALFGGISARSTQDSVAVPGRWSIRSFCERGSAGRSPLIVRAAAAWSQSGGEGGPFVEIGVKHLRGKGALDCSIAVFRIPSYASRFYMFGRDVPGRGATQPVRGRGASVCIVARMKQFSGRCRWVRSDLMENVRELTVQSDYKF